jgi:hypothetical protein
VDHCDAIVVIAIPHRAKHHGAETAATHGDTGFTEVLKFQWGLRG